MKGQLYHKHLFGSRSFLFLAFDLPMPERHHLSHALIVPDHRLHRQRLSLSANRKSATPVHGHSTYTFWEKLLSRCFFHQDGSQCALDSIVPKARAAYAATPHLYGSCLILYTNATLYALVFQNRIAKESFILGGVTKF